MRYGTVFGRLVCYGGSLAVLETTRKLRTESLSRKGPGPLAVTRNLRVKGLGPLVKRFKREKYLQVMALLGVTWMLVFNYAPMYGLLTAFKQNYRITQNLFSLEFLASPWADNFGFFHFITFVRDPQFVNILTNTLGISLLRLFIVFPLPIIFALFLNELRSQKFKRTVQTISYLPHFISWVVLGGILTVWLSEQGFINEILIRFRIIEQGTTYLAFPQYFWGIVIISSIWKELGWSSIIYLAVIAGIDQEMYEAAELDGCGRFRKMCSVTLPCMMGTITILFILAIGGLLNSNFDQILVLWNPLNAPRSTVIDIYTYNAAMRSMRFSYASAIGFFRAVIAFALLLGANTVTKKLSNTSLF
jgi:putative aldouronate transport system permease protein